MGILNILLEHNPDLGGQKFSNHTFRFPTPLHCAASSGWLSHAQALVEAGAPVYTGPNCSPLCWAKGGSGGSEPVAVYLREKLGGRGLAMIKADHERDFEAANQTRNATPSVSTSIVDWNFDEYRTVRSRLPTEKPRFSVNAQDLCRTCAGISLKDLCRSRGYFHLSSAALLRQSANYCKFCVIIKEILRKNCRLDQNDNSQIIIRISNGNKRHHGFCCDPPVLRALEFRLVTKCTCPATSYTPRSARDFSKCLGSCTGSQGTEVLANIYSENSACKSFNNVLSLTDFIIELTLTIPVEAYSNTAYDQSLSIQEGTVIDPDPLSSKSLKLIQKWIKACESFHQHCRRECYSDSESSAGSSHVPLPSRIIDVDSSDGSKIRVCNGFGKYANYVALSHRWVCGPMPQWVTTNAVLKSRENWFPVKTLLKSVVDAVQVTQKLGVRYLWVDSLCIIQDSLEDWEVESSRMAQVYANAHLTLFADCGRDDDYGFIFRRETNPSTTISLPKGDGSLLTLNIRRSSSSSFKANQFSLFPTNVEASYLSNRGWIFQERILSHRILHFGKDQMFWECNEGTFAEDGHIVSMNGQRECGQQDSLFSKLAYASVLKETSLMSLDSFASQWEKLVKAYCTLKLTKEEDKLPALAGLAAAFNAGIRNNDYIAGVWRQNLPRQLAWSITNTKPEKEHQVWQHSEYSDGSSGGSLKSDNSFVHPSQLFSRPRTYRAPSFSWAAVEGEIKFHQLLTACAQVESVMHNLPAERPYGRPKHASLCITGPFRQAESFGPFEKDLGGIFCQGKAGYIPLYDEGWPFGYLLPDSKDDFGERNVYCLKLGNEYYTTDVFLVLVPVQEENTTFSKFRRIGLGKAKSQFFTKVKVKTIKLF